MAGVKYVVVCCDGMSDRSIPELSCKTPLEAANTPNMDFIARGGDCGLLRTMVPSLPKDSGVANLAILGYDPKRYYPGRGPLEAANMGISLGSNDIVLRCNTITEENGVLVDYSGGHITSEESRKLIERANEVFGCEDVKFYTGVSYRHVLVLRENFSDKLICQPPHEIIGEQVEDNLIKAAGKSGEETAVKLNRIMLDSKKILSEQPVNKKRVSAGNRPANMLWFWGPGRKPRIPSFKKKFGLEGSVISAVDIIKGIGVSIGLKVVNVAGATGYLDTNYEGKADAALSSLKNLDFAYIHIEAPDEAGHEKNIEHKIKAIEDIDKRVIGRLLKNLKGDYVFGLLPDHATPISLGVHTDDLVPFAVYSTVSKNKKPAEGFSEENARKGVYGTRKAEDFMKLLLKAGERK